jgi:hypothetical protein
MPFDFSRSQFNDKIDSYQSYVEDNQIDLGDVASFEQARANAMRSQTDNFSDDLPDVQVTESYAGSSDAPRIVDQKPENSHVNWGVSLVDRSLNALTSRDNVQYSRRLRAKIYAEDAGFIQQDAEDAYGLLDELVSLEVEGQRSL